jgi:hypothetical protein
MIVRPAPAWCQCAIPTPLGGTTAAAKAPASWSDLQVGPHLFARWMRPRVDRGAGVERLREGLAVASGRRSPDPLDEARHGWGRSCPPSAPSGWRWSCGRPALRGRCVLAGLASLAEVARWRRAEPAVRQKSPHRAPAGIPRHQLGAEGLALLWPRPRPGLIETRCRRRWAGMGELLDGPPPKMGRCGLAPGESRASPRGSMEAPDVARSGRGRAAP